MACAGASLAEIINIHWQIDGALCSWGVDVSVDFSDESGRRCDLSVALEESWLLETPLPVLALPSANELLPTTRDMHLPSFVLSQTSIIKVFEV